MWKLGQHRMGIRTESINGKGTWGNLVLSYYICLSKIHFLNTFYAQLIILPKESRNQWQTERTRGDSRGNFVITDLSMTNSNSDIQLVANIQYTSIMQIEKHDTAQII